MLLPALLVFSAVLAVANSCSCLRPHPQELLCRQNSYAMLVTIHGEHIEVTQGSTHRYGYGYNTDASSRNVGTTPPPPPTTTTTTTTDPLFSYRKYRFTAIRIYKGPDITRVWDILYTPTTDGFCGVRFAKNTKYLITGTIHDKRIYVNYCNYIVYWGTENYNIISNLLNLTRACRTCQTISCNYSYHQKCPIKRPNNCLWDRSMQSRYVNEEMLNFLCVPTNYGRCEWNNMVNTETTTSFP